MLAATGLGMGQNTVAWQEYFDRVGQMEDAAEETWEQAYDVLEELAAHKLDLNRCSREDLQRLPFLSEQQIMDIVEYRDRARRIESMMELRLIPSLERLDADLLTQFVEIRPESARDTLPSIRNILKHGRHELVATLKAPFYNRKGDDNGYLGYKYKHWLRYTFAMGPQLRVGLVASQDAGEPFFAHRNGTGYDFYSFYAMLRHVGRLKALALGRYRLRFGMGLTMNNSWGMGKLGTLAMLGRSGSNILPHGSRSEANYLQGAATTVELREGVDLTAFVSWRKMDATLNEADGSVATLLKTGYHRTESEMARRRNTSQTVAGGRLGYFNNGWHVGATAVYTAFDRELRPNKVQAYRAWYPTGRRFWNVGADYGYTSGRLTLAGETAMGSGGHVATINSLSYRLSTSLSVMALQRYYPYQYVAIHGESFAEGGAVNNESGVYIGAHWTPVRGMAVTWYTDYAYFAWPKYQASGASQGWDHLAQVTYGRGAWDFLARYRFRMRQRDNADKNALAYRYEHRGRLAAAYSSGPWTARTQADLSHCRLAGRSLGYMVSQHAGYAHRRLQLHATLGYFHTDDYDSRIYVYERGMLYSFSFPMFYGQGIRYAVNLRADLGKAVVMVKVGTTNYFDRHTVGSGLQEVMHSSTTDLELQLRLKL